MVVEGTVRKVVGVPMTIPTWPLMLKVKPGKSGGENSVLEKSPVLRLVGKLLELYPETTVDTE